MMMHMETCTMKNIRLNLKEAKIGRYIRKRGGREKKEREEEKKERDKEKMVR